MYVVPTLFVRLALLETTYTIMSVLPSVLLHFIETEKFVVVVLQDAMYVLLIPSAQLAFLKNTYTITPVSPHVQMQHI